ncbi:hypothetical protein ACPC54_27900 [Kitasatospora sp. NPDC094028]
MAKRSLGSEQNGARVAAAVRSAPPPVLPVVLVVVAVLAMLLAGAAATAVVATAGTRPLKAVCQHIGDLGHRRLLTQHCR